MEYLTVKLSRLEYYLTLTLNKHLWALKLSWSESFWLPSINVWGIKQSEHTTIRGLWLIIYNHVVHGCGLDYFRPDYKDV